MERKIKFATGEFYHVFSRGVEKRRVFMDKNDKNRFQALLYITNQVEHFKISDFLKGNSLKEVFELKREKSLVSILCYVLVDNHFHIVVHEHTEGGISKFMMRLLTAYSTYFNKKYGRSGPLFVRPFRSVHIANESHFLYIFSYVHLNILDLEKRKFIVNDEEAAQKFISEYTYSSYPEYAGSQRICSEILDLSLVPEPIRKGPLDIKLYKKWLDKKE